MSTDEDRITALEERVRALEAQVANDHGIIADLAENGKRFYAALTALQNAFDGVCAVLDPNFKPSSPMTPPRELM